MSCVLSDRLEANGLDLAKRHCVPKVGCIDYASLEQRAEKQLHESLIVEDIDLIVLAGFMRILSPGFVKFWHGKLINIHPSLLPSFKGLGVHKRALQARVHFAGCSVHYVTEELDGGPIIGQAVTGVREDDDKSTLESRVLTLEHKLYPMVVHAIANQDVWFEQGLAKFKPGVFEQLRLADL